MSHLIIFCNYYLFLFSALYSAHIHRRVTVYIVILWVYLLLLKQGRRKPFEFGTAEYEYKLQSRSKAPHTRNNSTALGRVKGHTYVELLCSGAIISIVEGVILIIARMTFYPS